MKCTPVALPGGVRAIVCGARPRRRRCPCCRLLVPADQIRLCDWKTGSTGRTCDALVCTGCSTVPAPDKDLCRAHGEKWGDTLAVALS